MLTIGNESFVLDAVSPNLERKLKIRLVPMSTASAVLRQHWQWWFHFFQLVPMSTASAVLRRYRSLIELFTRLVPMSTASAVLRREYNLSSTVTSVGTYVYCFGGIETAYDILLQIRLLRYLCLLLRRYWDTKSRFKFFKLMVPMSTASAVLRQPFQV